MGILLKTLEIKKFLLKIVNASKVTFYSGVPRSTTTLTLDIDEETLDFYENLHFLL